jgi:hypothetical protein
MTEQIGLNAEAPEEVQVEEVKGLVDRVEAKDVNISDSFVGTVQAAGDAKVVNTIASAIVAGKNTQIESSVSSAVVAGGNIVVEDSGAAVMIAGGNIDIHDGGAGLLNCAQANVENSTIGVLLSGQVSLGDNVRVMMTQKQAMAFGMAFGLVVAAVGLIFRRRR